MSLNSEQAALAGLIFQTYVMEHHRTDVLQILQEPDEDAHYSLVVNAMNLFEANMEVGEYFNAFPSRVLHVFDEALQAAALAVSRSEAPQSSFRLKRNLHVRVSGKATKCTDRGTPENGLCVCGKEITLDNGNGAKRIMGS